MDRLKWTFELLDKISGPAKAISGNLKNVEDSMGDMRKSMGAADMSFSSLGTTVAAMATGFLAATGAAAFAFAKMGVDALSFKENTLTSFKLMLGSKEEANEIFKQAVQMAKLSPWETTDVVGGFKALLSAGFSKEDVGTVFAGLSDVAAASGFDKAIINSLAVQMAQVKAYGKLQMVDLRVMANQMAQAGVGIGVVYEHIAKNMGIGVEQVKDAMGRGEIDADVGIFSILEAIKEKASGGQALGSLTKDMGSTISGLFSTIKSSATDFFLTLEGSLEDMPGLMAFKGFLENLRDALDTNTAAGKRFQAIITGAFGSSMQSMFARFSGPEGMQRLMDILEGILKTALMAWDVFKAFGEGIWEAVKPMMDLSATMDTSDGSAKGLRDTFFQLGRAAGYFADGIAAIVIGFGWMIDKLKAMEPYLKGFQAFTSPLAFAINQGFGMGLSQSKAGTEAADAVVGDFETKLKIQSPSKVFQELGELSGEGFRLGMESGSAFDVGSVASPYAGPDTGTSTTGVTVQLTIQVDNTGHADGDAIAARLGEILPSQLATVFDQLAAEMGAQ